MNGDGLKDPYGVPTGYVPRVILNPATGDVRHEPDPDPVAKAVDDYLLMERKARAWDEAVAYFNKWPSLQEYAGQLDDIWDAVHPAQDSSTR